MDADHAGGLPETSRAELLEALDTFDEEYRDEEWTGWQSNRNHKYAIEHDGRRYPVKQVIAMATGRSKRSFDGGEPANAYVEEYGFDIVRLRDTLRSALEEILETYVETRTGEPFGKTDDEGKVLRVWSLFGQIADALEGSSVVSQRPHLQVDWSVGQGKWTYIPWIVLMDDRETSTTREGVYAAYLFRKDMSGLYLAYNQGVTIPTEQYGGDVAYAILRNRAERLRRFAPQLGERGFQLDESIDLRASGRLGRSYEAATVAHTVYEQGTVPSDDDLLRDLGTVLEAYDQYISRRKGRPTPDIDRARLAQATNGIIRPALIDRGDLEEGGREGYQHHEIIPAATPRLTPESIAARPREAILEVLRADNNLLSGAWDRSPATKFFETADAGAIKVELTHLLNGAGDLPDRVRRFLEWGEAREVEDGKTAELNGTVASYLLAMSDPQEYGFCKTQLAYRPAATALLGEDAPRSDWPERIAHVRDFYKEALRIFQEEHSDLPFSDLMHVHIAFFVTQNESDDAAWGEGVADMAGTVAEPAPGKERSVYKIAPGHTAEYWDDCRDEGYICVGWGDVGDLRQYGSHDEFRDAFREAFYPEKHDSERKISEKSREVWTLAQLSPGDLVVANRGISEVLAVGEVTEPGYEWRPDRPDYRHTVHVDWDESYAQEIPSQERWRFVTIQQISDELLDHILEHRGTTADGEASGATYEPPPFQKIYETIRERGMVVDQRTVRRYHVSLRTRGFVILSGVSGTGKTWLTKLYADAVRAERHLQPVAPNWTTNEDLLGYYNPVDGAYHHTAVSRFLQDAEQAYQEAQAQEAMPRPYHLVLDEMNLARVEYYFAKFLSKMEERMREGSATLDLGPNTELLLPPNLVFIGTVNIDETTHAFADKVYDRAQLIEMQAPRERLDEHLGGAQYADPILCVWDAIGDVAPFAFRVLDEIEEYVQTAQDHGTSWEEALDEQLLQKVLPKVKGTEPKVGEALRSFLEAVPEETYPLSHAKAQRMLEDFRAHGFTSYF